MENEFKRIINEHIPIVIRKLTNEQQYMDRWHKVTNAVTIGGATAGVAGLFIPVVGGGVAIAGSIVVIAALLLDLWGQKQTKKVTKALQEEFERNCQPAREAYEALLQSFYNFCVEYVKHNPDSPDLIKPQIAATPNYVSSSKALQQAKLPALQSVSCGTALGDLATTITSIAIDIEENSTKFVSILQKVIPIAGTVASTTAMLGGICSGYVLLDTLFNFLKPCRASRDIESHMQKLKNFQAELQHLLDKSNLGKMLMKSETNRIQAEKQISQLRKEITNLLPYKNQYEEKMVLIQQHHTQEIEYQTHQYQDTLKQLSQQFKQSLELEQQKHAECLAHEQQLHKKKLSDEKKQYEEAIKLTQLQHAEKLLAEKKLYEEHLMLEKQQHSEELKAQRLLLLEEKQQHEDKIKQYQDIIKQQEEHNKKSIEGYQNLLDAFLKQTQK